MLKKIYTLLLISFAQLAFPQMLAKYDFNGNSNDLSGNGHDGTSNGNVYYVSDHYGMPNSALNLDGSGWIDLGPMSLNGTDLTFSFWCRRTVGDGNGYIVLGQSSNTSLDNSFHISFTGVQSNPYQSIGFDFYADGLYDTTGAADLYRWNHWVLTYNYSSKIVHFYRNGQQTATDTLAGPYGGTGNLYIGMSGWSDGFFKGDLDDMRMWGQELNATQADSIYQAEKRPAGGLIAWYDFNGNANDISGNSNHGTPNNTTPSADRNGAAGAAYNFDGATSSVSCPALNLNATSFSIGFWTQRNVMDGNWHAVVTQGTGAGVDQGLHMGLTGTIAAGEQDIGFDFWGDGVYDTTGAASTMWNHWFFTYNYGNFSASIYRNGQFIRSFTLAGAYMGTGSVNIGFSQWAGNYFEGNIDEVMIYTSLLTATQVDSIYQSQKPVCASFGLTANVSTTTCFGYNNGAASVTTSSGITPFTFLWSDSQTAAGIGGLYAGTYTCVVTDAVGCKDSVTATVNDPPQLFIVMSATNTTCYGGTDGIADAAVSGGVAPYSFSWSPVNATTQTVYSLNAGMYRCNVIDTYGCPITDSVFVGQPAAMSGGLTVTLPNVCVGEPDTLIASVSGGQAPYWYEWHDFTDGITDTTYVDSLILAPIATGSTVVGVYIYDALGCSTYASSFLWANAGDSLSGTVVEPNLNPVSSGNAYLIKQKLNHVGLGDTSAIMPLNALGYFYTQSLPWGDYRLKIVADTTTYPNAVGTYYGTSPAAYQWDSAVVIQHRGCAGGNNSGKNVTLIEIVPAPGPCDISGTIYSVPGFGNRIGHGGFAPQGAPLKGVDIKLGRNPGGSPAARTTTDNSGYYSFSNVGIGSYRIYVDIPNYGMDSARTVNLTTTDTTSVKNDYYVDSTLVHVVPYYNISVVTSICNGDSIMAGGTYQHATGIYVDSLLAAMGGDSVITTDLTVNSLPMVTASTSADTVCSGNNVTLTGGGASTYTWSGSVADGVAFSPTITDTYTVTGTDVNGCNDTATVRVVVQTCIGINSYSHTAKVTAYPNPATDKIIVTCSGIPQSIQVQNMAGENVMDAAVSGNRTHVDVSKLAAGVYFVKVTLQNNESKFIKVIKN